MKKKTLLILLIIPFILSLLTFVNVSILTNTVASDITDIAWTYNENQGFKISSEGYKLNAKPIYDENLALAPGNNLVWSVLNLDGSQTEYASVVKTGESYYLYALKEGECRVICQNERGSVSKCFNAHIYEDGAIIINTEKPSSGSNIDSTKYYGQFDFVYSNDMSEVSAKEATFKLIASEIENNNQVYAVNETNNITIDENYNVVIKGSGPASIKFYTNSAPYVTSYFNFEIVKNGYNVYNYNDLLMCTNSSENGEIAVLQTHLESLENVYRKDANSKFTTRKLDGKEHYELFGNFNFKSQTFNFKEELKEIKSTYNTKYIEQYNSMNKGEYLAPNIKVGLYVQKDIYGNGYAINANGLTYPNHGKISPNGKLTPNTELDYFFGPLPFITIGSLIKTPVVKAYGQDNALIYVDKDGVTINDVKVKNCNEVDNMYNLLYTGSVIDVSGHDVTIKNSILSNGRTIVRAFSSDGLRVENSILKNAAQFIMSLGSDLYNSYVDDKEVDVTYEGLDYSNTLKNLFDYSNKNGINKILNEILDNKNLSNENELNKVMNTLEDMQSGLDNLYGMLDESNNVIYQDEIHLNKVYFSNSGMFSIAFETLFNGPYLYNGVPSNIHPFLELFSSVLPNKVGGTMYPVKLTISDDTKFYDWKKIDTIDSSILIEENISDIIATLFGKELKLSMEDYFPMKSLLKEEVDKKGYYFTYENEKYINSKIAWYGGGVNLSKAVMDIQDNAEILDVNLAESVLSGKYINPNEYVTLLARCVLLASGTHPFRFLTNGLVNKTPEEFNNVPRIEDLR